MSANADAKLVLGDGTTYLVHTDVLKRESPFFQRLFRHENLEEYSLEMVSADDMEQILCWMYGQPMAIRAENVRGIISAADRFECQDIVVECCKYLMENPTGSEDQRVELAFEMLSPEGISSLLKKDDLDVAEKNVFNFLMSWIGHDLHNRVHHLPGLIHNVRLGCVPHNFFNNFVLSNQLVKEAVQDDPDVRQLIDDAWHFFESFPHKGEVPSFALPRKAKSSFLNIIEHCINLFNYA